MESLEAARAIYGEEVDKEQSAASLVEALRRRAEEVRQGELWQEQEEFASETRKAVAKVLEGGAQDLQRTLGSSNPMMKDLPGNIAGQARLGVRGSMEIDTQVIVSDGPELINTGVAEAIRRHEERHEQQRQGDAAGVQVGAEFLSAHELYEWDAMKAETGSFAHSTDYEAIRSRVSAVLNPEDRTLVFQGRFHDLEQQKSEAIAA